MSIQMMINNTFEPYILLLQGKEPLVQINAIARTLGLPLMGIVIFLFFWSVTASNIETSLGAFPGPKSVIEQGKNLWSEHKESRGKEGGFYERQKKRITERKAKDPAYEGKVRAYTGSPTFIDQIFT